MAARNVLGAHAISALKDQAGRFEMMSVHLAKSPNLALAQADEISTWGLKVVEAVNKIRHDAQLAAAECHKRLQDKICELEVQADSRKRKILDTKQLDSSRTIKANFRLIFGPTKETEYSSKSTKHLMSTIADRINIIRCLCDKYPDSVIALSISYPTKVWTESKPELFNAIIGTLKQEKMQEWPDEILDIMNELQKERPMSAEFEMLRGGVYLVGLESVIPDIAN